MVALRTREFTDFAISCLLSWNEITMNSPVSLVRIWDLPTRVFHIVLGMCVLGLFVTGEVGEALMPLHYWLGYAVLSLIFFRLAWGLLGGHWSRFVNFVPSPSTIREYIGALRRGEYRASIGHNPLGALSVLSMLIFLLLQVFSGFLSDDEISLAGPWAAWAPATWVARATLYHTEIGKVVLIVLLVLHASSVLYYRFVKRDDLISPMVRGDKLLSGQVPHSRDTFTSRVYALSIWVACAYAVYRLVLLGI
jgi:cytochrome b